MTRSLICVRDFHGHKGVRGLIYSQRSRKKDNLKKQGLEIILISSSIFLDIQQMEPVFFFPNNGCLVSPST
jgi:hypothetical protein